jgi:ElaB/YqjD/DUF883 family membrane-anchored ribosome-binding protein
LAEKKEVVYAESDVLQLVTKMFTNSMTEVKDALNRVHERIDSLVEKDYITRDQFDRYQEIVEQKIKEMKGYPLSTVIISSTVSGLFVGLLMWMITNTHSAIQTVK